MIAWHYSKFAKLWPKACQNMDLCSWQCYFPLSVEQFVGMSAVEAHSNSILEAKDKLEQQLFEFVLELLFLAAKKHTQEIVKEPWETPIVL